MKGSDILKERYHLLPESTEKTEVMSLPHHQRDNNVMVSFLLVGGKLRTVEE